MKNWGYGEPEVRALLHAAIEKWERILRGEAVDGGTKDCPLCREFLRHSCAGCPVRSYTGVPGCDAAAYERLWSPLFQPGEPREANTPERRAAARAIIIQLERMLK